MHLKQHGDTRQYPILIKFENIWQNIAKYGDKKLIAMNDANLHIPD